MKKITLYCLMLTSLLLAACGGSSGGDTTTSPIEPLTETPAELTLYEGTLTITGAVDVGATLNAAITPLPSTSVTHQWLRNMVPIAGATQPSYTITTLDIGQTLAVNATVSVSTTTAETTLNATSASAVNTPASTPVSTQTSPNILLIIADDLGVDAQGFYPYSDTTPNTPNLDTLAQNGITFDNVWATPACTTTRAAIMTGKHGVNSGLDFVPARMETSEDTLFKRLDALPDANVSAALMGKWHLGGPNADPNHPTDSGVPYYAGSLSSGVSDYYNWEFTDNGVQSTSTQYHTSHITNLAANWIDEQTNPWFVWLAYAAPHSPFHLPPAGLYSDTTLSGTSEDISSNPKAYYFAAIEAMDAEVGRLLDGMTATQRDNTVVIYIGDNGTPARVTNRDVYIGSHSKGSLFEGGVRVPMVVSGKGVTRTGVIEPALINATDIFSTVLQLASGDTDSSSAHTVYDSLSFSPLLTQTTDNLNAQSLRDFNYTEFKSSDVTGFAVRDNTLKLIELSDNTQMLFDVNDISENTNLLDSTTDYSQAISQLQAYAQSVSEQTSTSTPSPTTQDITHAILTKRSANCADYAASYTSTANDIHNNTAFNGSLTVRQSEDVCIFSTNGIPNHDFNDGANSFPNTVAPQDLSYQIPAQPIKAATATALSLQTDNAILLNGVKVDILAAGCFGVGGGKTGCNDISTPWRKDPMFAPNNFNVDSHNAHSQGNGHYHYHGTPNALFDANDNSKASPVIGFAADGFPIYGPYIDDNGTLRAVLPSYQLKQGNRPSGDNEPGGVYDGAYRDDWEYVAGSGDLDACNGMEINGVYSYFVTQAYPYVLGCFSGTPDDSFNKQNP